MALNKSQREWYNLLSAEVRRQQKVEREQSSVPTVYVPRKAARVIEVRPATPASLSMSLPACLMHGSAAGEARRADAVLTREFWLRKLRIEHTQPVRPATRYAHLFA